MEGRGEGWGTGVCDGVVERLDGVEIVEAFVTEFFKYFRRGSGRFLCFLSHAGG